MRRWPSRLLIGSALATITVLSAGCASTGTSDVDMRNYDYRQRHPITVSKEPENLDMPVGMRGPALSPEIETAIRDYIAEYRANGSGPVTIQVPTGSANEIAAAETGRAVHYALVRGGVPHRLIKIAPYPVNDRSKVGTLRLSYLKVKAAVPHCGVWPSGSDTNFLNTDTFNFGCAQQQNLAAMAVDPADFVRPRLMTPASGGRRAAVIKSYTDTGNTGWSPSPETKLIDSGSTGGGG